MPVDNFASGGSGWTFFGASADLTHLVALTSLRLLPSDTASGSAISIYEVVDPTSQTPVLHLVNVDNNGVLIGGTANAEIGSSITKYQAVSADGSSIYFTATPTGGVSTLYARRNGTTTEAISNPSPAQCTTCDPTAKPGSFVGASSDGERGLLHDRSSLSTPTPIRPSTLYGYDAEAVGHHLTQVSGGGAGDLTPGTGAEVQNVVHVSEDGTHVYFIAKGVLTPAPNSVGKAPPPAPRTSTSTRATLPTRPAARALLPRCHRVRSTPLHHHRSSQNVPQATPDGRYLAFSTPRQLITSGPEADTDSATDIYRYDAQTGELKRVSIGEPSYPASNNGNTAGMKARCPCGAGRRIGSCATSGERREGR